MRVCRRSVSAMPPPSGTKKLRTNKSLKSAQIKNPMADSRAHSAVDKEGRGSMVRIVRKQCSRCEGGRGLEPRLTLRGCLTGGAKGRRRPNRPPTSNVTGGRKGGRVHRQRVTVSARNTERGKSTTDFRIVISKKGKKIVQPATLPL